MPSFRYRALTQKGEMVSGSIAASDAAEVLRRIEYLQLVPIDAPEVEPASRFWRFELTFGKRAQNEAVTIFTLDLALLLHAGARLDEALELLSTDHDVGGLRPTIAAIRSSVVSGQSFADSVAKHQALFPPIYTALLRIGETSGLLIHILQVLARERSRAEALRRKLADAIRYPACVLAGAGCVFAFFLLFVLPKFSAVLHDFGAKIDPIAATFFRLSDFTVANRDLIGLAIVASLAVVLFLLRLPRWRIRTISLLLGLPIIRTVSTLHRTALFCRNLEVLLAASVPLPASLSILADMMGTMSDREIWGRVVERVRHGGKLFEALTETELVPKMAVRMVRLGEESGQLPVLAGRVAEFYETKLQRSLDRVVALIGPVAIIAISVVVGGLIVSVMTSLLSMNELVG